MHPYVHSSTIYNNQVLGATYVPIRKLWYIYTEEYYSDVKNKKMLPLATVWIDMERIMLSEISQAVKDKYHVISHLTGT